MRIIGISKEIRKLIQLTFRNTGNKIKVKRRVLSTFSDKKGLGEENVLSTKFFNLVLKIIQKNTASILELITDYHVVKRGS